MANPYLGEIRMFAGNFAPVGWALCDGQSLDIANFEDLYMLIGTTYGGDGQSTFRLPDLRSRVPLHTGTLYAGAPIFVIAQTGGEEMVTLTPSQIPAHTHTPLCAAAGSSSPSPAGAVWGPTDSAQYAPANNPLYAMNANTAGVTGSNYPHPNVVPHLAINFIISLTGLFPTPP